MKWIGPLLITLLHLVPHPARADTEQARLAAQRRAVEQQFEAERADCAQRFGVTSCIEQARLRRRDALTALQKEQSALQARERAASAAQRRLAAQPEPASAPRPDGRAASGAASAPPRPSHVPRAADNEPARTPPASRAGATDRARHEREARAAYERRQAEAEAHRRKVQEREAARVAKGAPRALPLPPPASSPAR